MKSLFCMVSMICLMAITYLIGNGLYKTIQRVGVLEHQIKSIQYVQDVITQEVSK